MRASILISVLVALTGSLPQSEAVTSHPPGGNLTTPQLIESNGYPAEIHHVTTSDGYILELHRIPHGINDTYTKGRPVAFLQHCLLCSSADWIMNIPSNAFAYIVADAGYDVWLGNYRGNTYSRNHTSLDPDNGTDFWKFSWDEMGLIDLPNMLDYVLETTGESDLVYAGFSMGTTTYFALMSDMPEYASKVRVAVAMGPVAFLENVKGMVDYLAPISQDFDILWMELTTGEFLPSREITDLFLEEFCDDEMETSKVCYDILYELCGPDTDLLNKEYLPVALAHTPAGTSINTLNHYAQLILNGGFRKYDYGKIGNNKHYGQDTPPEYDLTKIPNPLALFVGPTDYLATPEDSVKINASVPNVIVDHLVDHPEFDHMDFIWATDINDLVYYKALDVFKQYTPGL